MVWKAPFYWDYQMNLSFAMHEAALFKIEADSVDILALKLLSILNTG